jgi:hypothetical protein
MSIGPMTGKHGMEKNPAAIHTVCRTLQTFLEWVIDERDGSA